MPKRKRDNFEGEPTKSAASAKSGQSKSSSEVEKKLFHAKKVLHRALKVAKRFERQKLARREKNAHGKGVESEVSRIKAEIIAWQELDLNVAAETHLFKSLLKEKAVLDSPLLPDSVRSTSKGVQDAPTANVTARLYNSQQVKDALENVLPTIRRALGVDTARTVAKKRQSETRHREGVQLATYSPSEDATSELDEDESMENIGEDTRDERNIDVDQEESDEDYAGLDSRLATDSGEEQEDEKELSPKAGEHVQKPANYVPEVDLSLSPSPSESESPPPIAKGNKPRKEANPASSSTFLPSLSMSGYYSGSDSASEPEADIEQLAPRKNRRGQRARQKIWEQKYKASAKHLQNNAGGKVNNARDAGWDMKRGAQMNNHRQERTGFQPRWKQERLQNVKKGDVNGNGQFGMAQTYKNKGKAASPQADKPIHPSWEAARRAKEQRQTGTFTGQKVVFD